MRTAAIALGLRLFAIFSVGASGGFAAASGSDEALAKRLVVEEALRAGFPPSLALAVADAASGFDAERLSGDGARGVMQIRPRTARHLGVQDPDALWDTRANARLGIGYLERLLRAQRGQLAPALAQMEQGQLPGDTVGSDTPTDSPFVQQVMALRQRYRAETQLWVEALKGAPVAWDQLRPHDDRLRRLARLARETEGPQQHGRQDSRTPGLGSAIERRRQAVLPYLDDFSG